MFEGQESRPMELEEAIASGLLGSGPRTVAGRSRVRILGLEAFHYLTGASNPQNGRKRSLL